MKCKICGKNEANGVCGNCFSLMAQMDKKQLEQGGCKVDIKLSVTDDVVFVDKYVHLPVVLDHINVTIDIADFKDKDPETPKISPEKDEK